MGNAGSDGGLSFPLHIYSQPSLLKRWGSETCLKAPNQPCEIIAFQNGGPTHNQSSHRSDRMDLRMLSLWYQ